MENVQLGDRVKDTVTGFQGIVVCISKWLHGCNRISIQPEKLKDGKRIEYDTFDEPQLKVLSRNQHTSTAKTGGWAPPPARRITPPQR